MEPTIKTYKFFGKILPDGHLSVPAELGEDTGREFEVIMKPVNDIARTVSLYLDGKVERKGRIVHIPTVAQGVFDVSGAGDTVIGAFTLALSLHADMADAAYISNFAAGIVVDKVGIAVVTQKELLSKIK